MKKKYSKRYKLFFLCAIAIVLFLLASLLVLVKDERRSANEDGVKYYVSATGNDSNSGLSSDTPLATINKGIEKAFPGDEIIVLPGSYHQSIVFNKSGTLDRPITVRGTDKTNTVIDGGGTIKSCVHFGGNTNKSVSNIVLDNISIINCYYTNTNLSREYGFGVVGWYDADNIILRNINMDNVGTTIKFSATPNCLLYYPNRSCTPYISNNILIENLSATNYTGEGISLGGGHGGGVVSHVAIRNVSLTGPEGGNSTSVDGVSTECASEGCAVFIDANGNTGDVLRDGPDGTTGSPVYTGGITIENTKIKNVPGDGIDMKADDVRVIKSMAENVTRNGMKVWGKRVVVENSIIQSNLLETFVIGAGAGGPFYLRNNIFHSKDSSTFNGYGHTIENQAEVYLFGNIFYSNNASNGSATFTSGPYLNIHFNKNIIYSALHSEANRSISGSLLRFFEGDVYRYCSGDEINGIDQNLWPACVASASVNKSVNPQFTDQASYDYTLAATSPAINAISGDSGVCNMEDCGDFPVEDILGNQRPEPNGTLADIGPYEFNSSGGKPFIATVSDVHSYPDLAENVVFDIVGGDSVSWEKLSGPGNINLVLNGLSASISADIVGEYVVQLRAQNSYGSTDKSFNIIVHKLADINGDNSINFTDFSFLLSSWGTPSNPMANIVRTGTYETNVDFQDFSVLLSKWGG